MLASARVSYDMIVIDCQPHSTRARTRSMARLSDTVLIVASYDTTKRNVMSAFARRMQHNGVAVCGVVFNFIPVRSQREHFHFAPDRPASTEEPQFAQIGPKPVAEIRSIH
jgi:Mrp family chromosome partitioning ATPase